MNKNLKERLELDGRKWVEQISDMLPEDRKILDDWYQSNEIDQVSKKVKDLVSLSKHLCE